MWEREFTLYPDYSIWFIKTFSIWLFKKYHNNVIPSFTNIVISGRQHIILNRYQIRQYTSWRAALVFQWMFPSVVSVSSPGMTLTLWAYWGGMMAFWLPNCEPRGSVLISNRWRAVRGKVRDMLIKKRNY